MYINSSTPVGPDGGSMPSMSEIDLQGFWENNKPFLIDLWCTICDYTNQFRGSLSPTIIVWLFFGFLGSILVAFIIYGISHFILFLKYGPSEYCQRPPFIEHDFDWLTREADKVHLEQEAQRVADKAWYDTVPQDHYSCSTGPHEDTHQCPRKSYTFTSQDRYHFVDSMKKKGKEERDGDHTLRDMVQEEQLGSPYTYCNAQEGHEYRKSYSWWIFRPKETPVGVRYVYSWKEPEYV